MRATLKKANGEVIVMQGAGDPSLAKKAKHLGVAFVRWMRAGYPKRSKQEIKACLAICSTCRFWKPKANFFLGMCAHPQCGCTKFKPQFATEDCPIGKWPKPVTTGLKSATLIKDAKP